MMYGILLNQGMWHSCFSINFVIIHKVWRSWLSCVVPVLVASMSFIILVSHNRNLPKKTHMARKRDSTSVCAIFCPVANVYSDVWYFNNSPSATRDVWKPKFLLKSLISCSVQHFICYHNEDWCTYQKMNLLLWCYNYCITLISF